MEYNNNSVAINNAESVVKSNVKMYDYTGVPGNEYKKLHNGVIVPRSTPEGGIEGGGKVAVLVRKQVWDDAEKRFKMLEEKEVNFDLSNKPISQLGVYEKINNITSVEEEVSMSEEPEMSLDEREVEIKELLRSSSETDAADKNSAETDIDHKLNKILKLVEVVVTKDIKKEKKVKEEESVILVKYEGMFGTINAAYKNVIVNDNCVVLIRSLKGNSSFYYTPPVDMEKEITLTVEFPNNPLQLSVINPGIEFNYPNTSDNVLVLLRVN